MSRDPLVTSPLARFLRLGGMAGRVGASLLGNRAANLLRSGPERDVRRAEALVRNAARIVETLGEMKGAAMKVGQMLSLHEGMLPPEVSAALRGLQREAPRVPFEVMRYEVQGALPAYDRLFADLEPEAHAAASIGQVHLGTLRDGRRVAVKIQYPLIEEIVKADLQNLRRLLQSVFAMFSDGDFDPLWRELRDRLVEELDYVHEAQNLRHMAELHADVPEIVIPAVVDEASARNVLTMEYVPAIPPARACSERYPQELRDRWGRVIFEFQLRGLFRHRFLHADPNLANFGFLEDGRVVVYDLGCTKRVPEFLALGYAELARAVLEDRERDVPEILVRLGIHCAGGAPVSRELTAPYVELFGQVFRESPPYVFGEDESFYERVMELGFENWSETVDLQFPEDIIFVNRTLGGNFGNLGRLRAGGPWRSLVRRYVVPARAESRG